MKAVSDVVAPLSGEIVEVNEALADTPEQINDDPYGSGWMVKIRLSNVDEVEAADGRLRLRGHPDLDEPLHLRHRCRPPGDAGGHRRELDRRALRRRARGGPARPPARPAAGQAGAGGLHAAARPRRAQRLDRGRDLVPRRGHVRPLRPEPDRLDPQPLGVPDALHALPARDLAGRAAGDVRVPDRDLRADRPAGLQRLASTRARARSPPPPTWRSCTTSARASSSPPASSRSRARRWRRRAPAGARRSRSCRSPTASRSSPTIGDDVSAVLVQYPNFLGAVEDLQRSPTPPTRPAR